MSAGEGIVFAFQRSREWTDAVQLAVGTEVVAATCQDFMSVSLMSYIPYDTVVRGVEDIMKGYGYFNHTKRGGKMTRIYGNLVDNVFS